MDDTFLTTAEVIDYLHVNLRTVYRLLKAGELPAFRVGRQWRFRRADVDAWLDGRRSSGRAAEASSAGSTIVPASSPGTAPPSAGAAPRILVADDEEAIRGLLARTLALAEYDVRTVADGQSAIDLLRAERFQLLITDLRMPGIDGLEVIREARRLSAALPVVIITGFPSEASAIEAINLGVSGYLTKPFRVAKVLAVAAKALGE
jgi:excisionase family DNA binding protein